MNNLVELAVPVGAVVVFILVVGLTIARLYRRASKEVAFVRTGVGGEKVVMNGGALVLPVLPSPICRYSCLAAAHSCL